MMTAPHTLPRLMLDSKPSPERSPARMALLGTLFGMSPALPSRGKVLELGCGCGSYLMQLALTYPQSTFLGIDNSQAAIETAEAARAELKVTNAAFQCQPLERLNRKAGEFDY